MPSEIHAPKFQVQGLLDEGPGLTIEVRCTCGRWSLSRTYDVSEWMARDPEAEAESDYAEFERHRSTATGIHRSIHRAEQSAAYPTLPWPPQVGYGVVLAYSGLLITAQAVKEAAEGDGWMVVFGTEGTLERCAICSQEKVK